MNTRLVNAPAIWAVLAMEAGIALPLISLPAQGPARPGAAGPLLLLLLLPGGYLAVRRFPTLRDPSWRLLVGIGLALVGRLLVTSLPAADPSALLVWFGSAVFPCVLGIALWWRGSATSVAEMTASEVRTEFSILALCGLAMLALMRPFVLPDPAVLLGAVVLFAIGGLLANALARQDAAEAGLARSRPLAASAALLPCLAAALLVGILRPALLGTFWDLLVRAIELLLLPIGWLLAWLASLLPRGAAPTVPTAPPPMLQPPPPTPNLDQMPDQMPWLGTLILVGLLLLAAVFALVVARLMLEHWLQPPPPRQAAAPPDLSVEHSGTAGGDARALFGWLWRWLRGRLHPFGPQARPARHPSELAVADAWRAYRALLAWAAQRGLGRRPSETTGELQSRLSAAAPTVADDVALVTSVYEGERYGELQPPPDRLRRLGRALAALDDQPASSSSRSR